jgi:hypothetical protein
VYLNNGFIKTKLHDKNNRNSTAWLAKVYEVKFYEFLYELLVFWHSTQRAAYGFMSSYGIFKRQETSQINLHPTAHVATFEDTVF